MEMIGVHDAKTHLSKLIQRVCQGEEIVVSHFGHPVAKLIPFANDEPMEMDALLSEIVQLRASGPLLQPGETLKDLGRKGLE